MTNPDIPVLANRAKQGDRKAFESLVTLTARMVYAQIAAVIRDRQKSEDLTQETFIAAWKALPNLGETKTFSAWLLTLARNKTLDALRFEKRQKRRDTSALAPGSPELPDRAADPSEESQVGEECRRALKLLEELPEDYRRPLMLRYLGGADYETIRRQLGLSDGALRGLLNRGMAMLRERMTKQER